MSDNKLFFEKWSIKKNLLVWSSLLLVVIFGVILLREGPGGIKNGFTSWSANWSGKTNWLIVQYTVRGDIMNSWEIDGTITHEHSGDGIYFTTNHGIIHLAGHYIFVQNPTDEARTRYLKK